MKRQKERKRGRLWPNLKKNRKERYRDRNVRRQNNLGSGCDSVGRAVASNTRDPQCESSPRQKFKKNKFTLNCWKDENKQKRGGIGPFFKKRDMQNDKNIQWSKVWGESRKVKSLREREESEFCLFVLQFKRHCDLMYRNKNSFDGRFEG